MTGDRVLHSDAWGEVIDRPAAQILEIRWFDETRHMSREGFNQWLTRFAAEVEATRRPRVLVDTAHFGLPAERMDGAWRDLHIVPRYNAAGVERFAFLVPPHAPPVGAPPVRQGPAEYLTAYFGARGEALAWLAGG
ncbi:MAG: hypothetical protein R3E10_10685 [Gemmatimonadota bacterium]